MDLTTIEGACEAFRAEGWGFEAAYELALEFFARMGADGITEGGAA